MNKHNLVITTCIASAAVAISAALWWAEIYFFFLPLIFLPFLRLIKFKPRGLDTKVCPICEIVSNESYCARCGTRLV